MNYRQMGRTGMRVSELCLGTMTFGRETAEADSIKILDRFSAAGGNFIDTANVYSGSNSEQIIGRWLKGRNRDDFVVATKVRFRTAPDTNGVGLSRKHILTNVEQSLRRLGTDYIDLYQVHTLDADTPLEETLDTLNSLVQAGKVRYLGASNLTGYQLQKAIDTSRHNGWEPFACLQPLYNLLERSIEWELLPVCRNEGVGVIPWSPLCGGWLSGKYRRDMPAPSGTRVANTEKIDTNARWAEYATDRTWNVIDALLAIAGETGKTCAHVALNWALNRPGITAPILGVRTMAHLEDNLGAAGWTLSAEQMSRLNLVSNTAKPYPYNFLDTVPSTRV